MHHVKRRHKQCKSFCTPICRVMGHQVQYELEQTSLSRPAREKMVVDPVGLS